MTALDPITALNAQYAVMAVGNKVVVVEFDAAKQLVEMWPFEEFRKRLIKRKVQINKKAVPLADAWLHSPRGAQYDRLVYAMPGSAVQARERDYNGWQGFRVAPAPGDWSKNYAHVRDVLCRGDEAVTRWVLNWCAALIQMPGRRAFSAIVLQGGQGAGKGHFATQLLGGLFYPQQFIHLIGAHQLTATFNDHLSGKVYAFADETMWGGDLAAAQHVKGLITEATILINRKYIRQVEEPNALHIVMASNSDFPVRVEADDRRYCVLEVSDDRRNDETYFAALRAELAAGGLAAFLHDMQTWALDDAALRHPPGTEGKAALKVRSFGPEERWLQNWLMNVDGQWTRRVPCSMLYDLYAESFARRGEPRSLPGFSRFLHRVFTRGGKPTWPRSVKMRESGSWRHAYEFPALADCRDAFDVAHGTQTAWPTDDGEQDSLL